MNSATTNDSTILRRWRRFVLPIAAVLICLLSIYKLTRSYDDVRAKLPEAQCIAPLFDLPELRKDKIGSTVRLARYVGRHRIVVIFFDASRNAKRDDVLYRLRELYPQLKKKNIEVIAISNQLPNNSAAKLSALADFPFPVLFEKQNGSQKHRIHRQWGRYDSTQQKTLTGTFLINRAGQVTSRGNIPKPLPSPLETINAIASGS